MVTNKLNSLSYATPTEPPMFSNACRPLNEEILNLKSASLQYEHSVHGSTPCHDMQQSLHHHVLVACFQADK